MSDSNSVPGVPGAVYKFATVNDVKYRYIVAKPSVTPIDTVLLIHGFPDLALGWRNQITSLVKQNFRVIVPDQLGYGGTDAPESYERYTLRKLSKDLVDLVKLEVGSSTSQIILGGHDWGGWLAWRLVMWYPEFVKAIFVVCTPYFPSAPTYHPLDVLVKTPQFASFGYQIQFRDGEVEKYAIDELTIRGFLAQLFGASRGDGSLVFSVRTGADLSVLKETQNSPVVPREELDLYAKEQARNGLHGPLNWYRTRALNFEDEKWDEETKKGLNPAWRFTIPALFIQATQDVALVEKMANGMKAHFDNLTWDKIEAGHWVLISKPEEVNTSITNWLAKEKLVSAPHI